MFLLYINDLVDVFSDDVIVKWYADDVKLYSSCTISINDIDFELQMNLDKICKLANDWQLPISYTKCNVLAPLPSNRHHPSNGDCLEGKRENYQVCSVQYCVQQLCTVQCTDTKRPNSSLDGLLSHWAHFTVRRFIFVYVLFCVHCMHV